MKVQFLGATRTVTGSCYLIETQKSRFLIDCGMFQGSKALKERNYASFLFDPAQIDFVLLTHAHIDHSGMIPKLYRYGFRGPIYCTAATADLCGIMLPDSAHIQEMEVERKNRKFKRAGKPLITPIYKVEDAEGCLQQFRRISYGETLTISPEITVRFQDAGHILGSSLIEIWIHEQDQETKLVFSGDVGNYNRPLMKDPTIIESADYLFLECTYGDRMHKEKHNNEEEFRNIIVNTLGRGGNVVIPAFAVERTQDLIYTLSTFVREKSIPPVPIIIDSPLAIRATEVFRRHLVEMNGETQDMINSGHNPFEIPGLTYSMSAEESRALNDLKGGAIIISASGMADAGRIKHHLKHNLWRPQSSVVFVGYQAEGTLGRRLLDGEKMVRIHGEEVMVQAEICNLEGFSGHSDRENLLRWVKRFRVGPGCIFLVHGEEAACEELAQRITQDTKIPTYIPNWLEVKELLPVTIRLGASPSLEAAAAKEEDLAVQVERSYFQLRMLLREMVEKEMDDRNYEWLLTQLKELEKQVYATGSLGGPELI
ncbi:MAG: MBL fold metallo-hydrolase [Syntrophomonadaceae bacterium]|nr:MBL fold metallo-hydrolase [Syntrophomonadaceae bacterium]